MRLRKLSAARVTAGRCSPLCDYSLTNLLLHPLYWAEGACPRPSPAEGLCGSYSSIPMAMCPKGSSSDEGSSTRSTDCSRARISGVCWTAVSLAARATTRTSRPTRRAAFDAKNAKDNFPSSLSCPSSGTAVSYPLGMHLRAMFPLHLRRKMAGGVAAWPCQVPEAPQARHHAVP